MAEEKAHKATSQKLKKSRKEGKVLKSQALTQSFQFLVVLYAFVWILRVTWVKNRILLDYCVSRGYQAPGVCLHGAGKLLILVSLVCLGLGVAISVLIEIAQVGFKVETQVLQPKVSHFDLAAGLRRIFGSFRQLWLRGVQVLLLGLVIFYFLYWQSASISTMFFRDSSQRIDFLLYSCLHFVTILGSAMVVFGGLEYLVKRREYFRELSMSEKEVREEFKDSEGDPMQKSARRSLHEELLMQNIVKMVKNTKVIIVEKA